jgi:hypothetical protein
MNKWLVVLLIIPILACGVVGPAALVDYPTLATTPTTIHRQATAEIRQVNGWWNLRDAPAGAVIGDVMDEPVQVLEIDGDWARTPNGWICRRAFGIDVRCVINQ